MRKSFTKSIVFTALFAALTAASGFIAIPLVGSPIPIVLQNMMVVLSGMILGPMLGTASTVLFIAAGLLGLPVLSGGTGGIAKLMGPTGGFIIGYAFSSLASGLVLGRPNLGQNRSLVRIIIASLLGFVLMYIPGVFHFMRSMDKTLKETMALCVLPYLPGDAIKMVLCIVLAKPLRKTVSAFVFDDDLKEENEDR